MKSIECTLMEIADKNDTNQILINKLSTTNEIWTSENCPPLKNIIFSWNILAIINQKTWDCLSFSSCSPLQFAATDWSSTATLAPPSWWATTVSGWKSTVNFQANMSSRVAWPATPWGTTFPPTTYSTATPPVSQAALWHPTSPRPAATDSARQGYGVSR